MKLPGDADPRIRRRAALALGRVGSSEGVDALGAVLADTDFAVREAAAFGLGLGGDVRHTRDARAGAARRRAIGLRIVRGRAAEALGLIGDRPPRPQDASDAWRAQVAEHIGGLVSAMVATGRGHRASSRRDAIAARAAKRRRFGSASTRWCG